MMCVELVILLSSFVLHGNGASFGDSYRTAPYCGECPCPKYLLVERYKGCELRKYEPAIWISSHPDNIKLLNQYIDGGNKEGLRIPRTMPLLSLVPNAEDVNASIAIFIPPEMNPPTPLDQRIHVEQWPALYFYVRHYEGAVTEENLFANAQVLADEINEMKKKVYAFGIYCSRYDSQSRQKCHNTEVAFLAEQPR